AIFLNFNLFLKNYFYNLFYNEPNLLFNFISFNNLSSTLPIPFIGMVPVIGGIVYCLKIKLNKINVAVLCVATVTATSLVFLFGDITIYFFVIVIIPLLAIGILNIRHIERNFLSLLILTVSFIFLSSVVYLTRAYHLFPIWITIITLNAIFFIEVIPKILSKVRRTGSVEEFNSRHTAKVVKFSLIVLILLVNVISSYALVSFYLYPHTYVGIKNEVSMLFQRHDPSQETGFQVKQIGDMLARQPGIENSYVMSDSKSYTYYVHSKLLYVDFTEGPKNDTLDKYITREDWSPFQIWFSNISSYPPIGNNMSKPVPDYLIYETKPPLYEDPLHYNITQTDNFPFLLDPSSPKIPSTFQVIYKSQNIVVYKIDHRKT
ncbi:MAG: hypothetical protein KGL95_03100, partial [Patescibacteria group bacterium]|nr:hypothetical protein [Patescibacteria group bacterium]